MSELQKNHPQEVSRYEFEPNLTEAERVAVVCAYVVDALLEHRDTETTEALCVDLQEIADCETTGEAIAAMTVLEGYLGEYGVLFDALAVAGLIEGHEPGNAQALQQGTEDSVAQSVTLGRGLLQLAAKPLDT